MGRSRLTLKCISNNGIRKTTFMKRRDGLAKKLSEYCSLADIAEACLVVFDDDNSNCDRQPMMTWPEDITKVHSLIEKYENQKTTHEEPPTIFGIKEYFEIKKDLVEAEISKVRKEILNIKYPTWDPRFNNLSDEQLQNFMVLLDNKIEACSQRKKLLTIQDEFEVILAQPNNVAQNSTEDTFMQKNVHSQPIRTPINDNQVGSTLDISQQVENVDVPQDSDNIELDWDNLHELVDYARQCGLLDNNQVENVDDLAEPDWDSLHEFVEL